MNNLRKKQLYLPSNGPDGELLEDIHPWTDPKETVRRVEDRKLQLHYQELQWYPR